MSVRLTLEQNSSPFNCIESFMNRLKGQFFTRENTVEEKLDRGLHHWFSRPDITGSEDLIVVRVEVGLGEGHPFHIHPDMDEVIYILSGRAEQWIEEEKKILESGESVFVPKKMVHATFRSEEHTSELQSRGHLVCR